MKIMLVAGARPNFMKIASVIDAISAYNRSADRPIEHLLVHTGQHYDEQMSQAFFRDLALPAPDVDLEVGSSSHAGQTAEIMKRFEPVLLKERPDVILVVGDVNSTVACALVASKISYSQSPEPPRSSRPLVAHVEAGLRSFDRSMPEEINRVLTDAVSDFLFTTEESAAENLLREGIARAKIHFVGNTMIDTLLKHRQKAQESKILFRLGLRGGSGRNSTGKYAVVTLHRPANVDNREAFQGILDALSVIAKEIPIFFPVHPRTLNCMKQWHLESDIEFVSQGSTPRTNNGIRCLEPLGYLDFLCLMSNAGLVLTDSGGIQEETTALGVPCVTLRRNTERPVTITQGSNILAKTNEDIVHHAFSQLNAPAKSGPPKFWDGRAGERIIEILNRQIA